jgi:hypothetical protein
MTPAKKLASHRFGEFRGVKPVWNRGFKGVSPLNPPVIPPKGGIQSNFKWLRFLDSGSPPGMTVRKRPSHYLALQGFVWVAPVAMTLARAESSDGAAFQGL